MGAITPEDFSRRIEAGATLERALDWEAAAAHFAALAEDLRSAAGGPEPRARRALALLRRANALMELSRWDAAREALDEALAEAKAGRDPAVVAQALLASGVYATNRGDLARAKGFLMDALKRFHASDERTSVQGRGWAFLNLAVLYGKTGRLDLAFVTLTKAQDVLGSVGNWAGVAATWEAQAQLRRAIHDEDRWREDLAEAVIFYDREGMTAKADRLRTMLGRKVV